MRGDGRNFLTSPAAPDEALRPDWEKLRNYPHPRVPQTTDAGAGFAGRDRRKRARSLVREVDDAGSGAVVHAGRPLVLCRRARLALDGVGRGRGPVRDALV